MQINISLSNKQPQIGDLVEFLNDRLTDKGPCTGKVIHVEHTIVTVRLADSIIKLDSTKHILEAGRHRYWAIR
jgi:hypothetical protein